MTTNSQGVRQASSTPAFTSQTDFAKLTKAELVERLKFSEYLMIHMYDWYKRDSLKPASHPFFRDYERGFAAAMETALKYLRQSPDCYKKKMEGEVDMS